jgi:hypothetical protein
MPDIREALEAAMQGADSAETEAPESTAAPEPADPPKQEAAEGAQEKETVRDAISRARDDIGRFTRHEPYKGEQPKPEAQEPAPVAEAKQPPRSWKKDYHDHWTKLEPTIQDYVLQREEEYFRGVGAYKQAAEIGQQLSEAARPYEATFRAMGVNPIQAFSALANADHVLRTSDPATKAQLFAKMAQEYGVDVGNIANPPQVDPAVSGLHSRYAQLEQQIQEQQRMYMELQQSMLEPQIQQFAVKPHFEELRPTMAQLLRSGMAETLEDAYDKALRLTPHYEANLAQQRQADEQRRAQEAAQAAAKARAAAVQVKGGPSTALPETKRDIRGALEAAFDSHIR